MNYLKKPGFTIHIHDRLRTSRSKNFGNDNGYPGKVQSSPCAINYGEEAKEGVQSSKNSNDPQPASADPGILGLSLGHFMKERNLSPRQLSEISGVPLPRIRNLQYGKTKIPAVKPVRLLPLPLASLSRIFYTGVPDAKDSALYKRRLHNRRELA